MSRGIGPTQEKLLAHLRQNPYRTAYDLMEGERMTRSAVYRALRSLHTRGMVTQYKGSNPSIWHLAHYLPPHMYACGHYHARPEDVYDICRMSLNTYGTCPACAKTWATQPHADACCRAPKPKKTRASTNRRWVR